MPMMDLPNLRGTESEVKIRLRFDRNSKFLTAQDKPSLADAAGYEKHAKSKSLIKSTSRLSARRKRLANSKFFS